MNLSTSNPLASLHIGHPYQRNSGFEALSCPTALHSLIFDSINLCIKHGLSIFLEICGKLEAILARAVIGKKLGSGTHVCSIGSMYTAMVRPILFYGVVV